VAVVAGLELEVVAGLELEVVAAAVDPEAVAAPVVDQAVSKKM